LATGDYNAALIAIRRAIRNYANDGIAHIPEEAEDPQAYPFIVVYPSTGLQRFEIYGQRDDYHNVVIEYHINEQDVGYGLARLTHLIEAIPQALKTAELASELTNVTSFGDINYSYQNLGTEERPSYGIRWIVNEVKLVSTY